MKILHTSDWHIGKKLYTKDLEDVHLLFFEWLIQVINEKKVDALLISGDVFDIAYPPNNAQEIYFKFLTQLHNSHCKQVIITGGNHDSVSTLNAPRNLLKYLNISVFGGIEETPEKQFVELKQQDKVVAAIAAVPFLRDREIRKSQAAQTSTEIATAIREGIAEYYSHLANFAQKYKEKNIPCIAMGHLFVSGASTSDSEREIHVGNLGNVPHNMLPSEFNYYALGHIHKPQIIAKQEHIRYSGSPIPLSFSERNDPKQVVLLDVNGNNLKIESLVVPELVKLVHIKGNYENLQIEARKWENTQMEVPHYFEVEIVEKHFQPDLSSKVNEFLTESSLEILNHKIKFEEQDQSLANFYQETEKLKDLSVKDVFKTKIKDTDQDTQEMLINTFNELLENYHNKE